MSKLNLYPTLIALFLIFGFAASAQTTLMSYNIRYANRNDGENSWSNRKDFLANQIKFYEPDIMGVQEALFDQLKYLDEQLNDYEYLGVGRDGGEKGEFSAIFYNTEEFDVLEKNTFWLSETPDEISKGWDAALNRICTYALFENEDTGEKFWVFNTHFDHRGEEARRESAKLIISKITEINDENLPVVLMGDLNLEPETESIQFLSNKMNDSKKVAEDVVFGPEGTYNGFDFIEPVQRRIDYIFTSKNDINVLKYAVLSDSQDLRYASDHLPVFVELEL